MINVDFSTLSSYRSDGRKSQELRYTSIELGVDAHADGSCLLRQGLTEVLCLVNGPYQRPSNSDFLLKIEYTVAPFSSL
jgi:ribonuclease PH